MFRANYPGRRHRRRNSPGDTALARGAVVAAPSGERGVEEALGRDTVGCLEGEVKTLRRHAVVAHEELVGEEVAVGPTRELPPEGAEDRGVESLARLEIPNAEVNVVDQPAEVEARHAPPSVPGRACNA